MRRSAPENELSEIRVDCHDNSIFCNRPLEHRDIAGIASAFTRFDDVMALITQPAGQTMARAAVDEELHFDATRTASSESRAMTA